MPKVVTGQHTRDTLKNIMERLDRVKDQLEVLRGLMETNEVPELTLKYHSEALKAIGKLDAFAAAGIKQFDGAREKRGDFGVQGKRAPGRTGSVPENLTKPVESRRKKSEPKRRSNGDQ